MSDTLSSAVGYSVGLVILALAAASVAALSRSGSLEPNSLIGLKTKATKSSAAAWYAGHAAARPALWTVAVVSVAAVVTIVGAALSLGDSDDAEEVVAGLSLGGYALGILLTIFAGIKADRAAKHLIRGNDDGFKNV